MGDMGEIWRATRDERRLESHERKEHNRKCSTQLLIDKGYKVQKHNGGIHLVVSTTEKVADFWPSTGKWTIRGTDKYRRGVKQLIKELNAS